MASETEKIQELEKKLDELYDVLKKLEEKINRIELYIRRIYDIDLTAEVIYKGFY